MLLKFSEVLPVSFEKSMVLLAVRVRVLKLLVPARVVAPPPVESVPPLSVRLELVVV